MNDAGGDRPRGDNVVLIGYRGCGKTSVGRALAVRLGRPFVDTDESISDDAGCSIREIFTREGEPAFREREHDAIERVGGRSGHVISVGGGAVLREDNRALLRAAGRCVWLMADAETLIARLRSDPQTACTRPSLTADDLAGEVRTLLAQRLPYYESLADERIDTAGLTIDQVVARVLAATGLGVHDSGG